MPVSPMFARHLHDKLGAAVTAGLVEWCDSVENAFRLELRDLGEACFARFDAKLEQRTAELRAEVSQAKSELRQDIANLRAELIKWAFVFFATAALAVIGLR